MRAKQEARQVRLDDDLYATIVRVFRKYIALRGWNVESLRTVEMIVRGLESAIQWSIKRRRSILRERARCDTVAACEATECTRVVLPPRLLFDELLGRFMSHSAYNRYIRPTIADMHHEYFQCLANKDKRGARWAVIRGHMYVIPSWVWLCLMRAFERVLAK